MKFLTITSLCLTTALVVISPSKACDPKPGCTVRPVVLQPVKPMPPANPTGGNVRPGSGDEVVWDLPAAEKQKIKKAVLLRETTPVQSQTQPAPAPTAPVTPANNEALANALAAHKALAGKLAKLTAKKAEIQKWDSQAQEKFRQAFGTTDEQVRKAVLQRIDQQIQETSRLLTTLADSIRFEFYVSRDKR